MRIAGFLGQIPEGFAIGHPAMLIVVPVDPGAVGQPMLRYQGGIFEVDGRHPAILVVVGHHLQQDLATAGVPANLQDRQRALIRRLECFLDLLLIGPMLDMPRDRLPADFSERVFFDPRQYTLIQLFE